MKYKILILSRDAVFARMLELEFCSYCPVNVVGEWGTMTEADTLLWDLDSVPTPPDGGYERLIGFTRNSAAPIGDTRRCSLVLRRPFEMRLLRRELFSLTGALLEDPPPTLPKRQASPELDVAAKMLRIGERKFALTPKELQLLRALLQNKGNPVSREELSAAIGASSSNKLDVMVCMLRKKVALQVGTPIIRSVRGKGYAIVESIKEE